jgi:Amt family ammonium transporter
VGGTLGALLTGFFATQEANPNLATNLKELVGRTLWLEQLKAIFLTVGWSVAATAVLALVVKVVLGLRADPETEEMGLDQVEHGEAGYHFEEAGG